MVDLLTLNLPLYLSIRIAQIFFGLLYFFIVVQSCFEVFHLKLKNKIQVITLHEKTVINVKC